MIQNTLRSPPSILSTEMCLFRALFACVFIRDLSLTAVSRKVPRGSHWGRNNIFLSCHCDVHGTFDMGSSAHLPDVVGSVLRICSSLLFKVALELRLQLSIPRQIWKTADMLCPDIGHLLDLWLRLDQIL